MPALRSLDRTHTQSKYFRRSVLRVFETVGPGPADDGAYPLARSWTIMVGEHRSDHCGATELCGYREFAPQPSRRLPHLPVLDQHNPLDGLADDREVHLCTAPRR